MFSFSKQKTRKKKNVFARISTVCRPAFNPARSASSRNRQDEDNSPQSGAKSAAQSLENSTHSHFSSMPQEAASAGLVAVVDPDSLPPSSSPPPQQQLSPETLRELVLACGKEAEEDDEDKKEASSTTLTRERLRGQLGFCFEPMTWESAAAAIADGGVSAMGRMGRTPEGVARYWRWRDEVCAAEYATTADYVRIEIMGCEAAVAGGELRWFGGGGVFFFVFSSCRVLCQQNRANLEHAQRAQTEKARGRERERRTLS